MSPQELEPRVLTFLTELIGSPDQFHLLLRLIQYPDRWWDAASVADDLGLSERDAQRALDHLARQNLLDIRITGDVRYRFRPGTEHLSDAAHAAAESFRLRPMAVLQVLTGGNRRTIRDFADAFRIRRDDDR